MIRKGFHPLFVVVDQFPFGKAPRYLGLCEKSPDWQFKWACIMEWLGSLPGTDRLEPRWNEIVAFVARHDVTLRAIVLR